MKHCIFSILLSLFTAVLAGQDVAVCGFTNKKVITIQGSQVTGGPHTNFPILIDHTDAVNLTTAAGKVTSANGFDIIFADDNANLLDFQLESYNGATGEIVAWVKIPTLTNAPPLDIHMLYGKATVVTDQSTTGVWDANYVSIYHMNNNDFSDATVNTNNIVNSGSTNNTGSKIGGGRTVNSSNLDYMQVGTSGWAPGSGTIGFWGNPSSFCVNYQY
mgnify:FL=1